ncbi:DUF6094 domain-containing protein [Robertmurraya massiliosenegalensis]|uniref:DUF6094 domain-containing protein n=1 Tax=Robertmurraya massiliosenegalensis TaxID=1287657 RepID=UPI0003155AA5|nr:DUF6094 domain-containing protein [Robertmurraya massiliosenegalensis]
MARIESEAKGGFYPTSTEEMDLILKRLSCKKGESITLLDPCCGKGLALKQWKEDMTAKGANPTSYGIEIEKSRGAHAESINDHVAKCGYEETRMSHDAFSAMYLNPPFMHMNGERMELTFLRDLTSDYLQSGGVLIFNLPQYILKDVAKILASRFVDIKVYRFTDANYDSYKQVIVYGVRRRKGLRSEKERQYQVAIEKELYNFSFLGKEALPSLDIADWDMNFYTIPKNEKPVALFQSMKVEEDDILLSLQSANKFYEKVADKIKDLNITTGKQINPAMPLKITHIATAIASGTLPENMGDHLLVGVSKRVQEQKVQINPKSGKEEEVTTFKPKSIVRVFSEKGIFNLK